MGRGGEWTVSRDLRWRRLSGAGTPVSEPPTPFDSGELALAPRPVEEQSRSERRPMTVMVHLGVMLMLIMLAVSAGGAAGPGPTRSAAAESKPAAGPTHTEGSGCGSDAVPRGAKLSERDAIAATFGRHRGPCRRFDTRFYRSRDAGSTWAVGLTVMGCRTEIEINAVNGELAETAGVGCS